MAVSRNGVIGRDGDLPWRLPSDLKRFKALTLGKPVLMGRRTWDSIGRPLPGRRTLVVTRQHDWQAAGAEVAHSLEEALQLATTGETTRVYIAGGGELYRQALPMADVLLLTELADEFEGDAHFPEISTERPL